MGSGQHADDIKISLQVITIETYQEIVDTLHGMGYGGDITWSENVKPPDNPDAFAEIVIWVLCCSGMKFAVARLIEGRVLKAIEKGQRISEVFGHDGKAAAMQNLWDNRQRWFKKYQEAEDKLAFFATLPWIGEITKFHVAKNFGLDVAKPDVHLKRLADREGVTSQELCERLAKLSGHKVRTVDLVLWRACATGVVNSVTGEIRLGSGTAAPRG